MHRSRPGWFTRPFRGTRGAEGAPAGPGPREPGPPTDPVRPRRRGRFGFWGPIPYYTARTRRGSEVSVGGCGCCLPLPLIGVVAAAAGLRAVSRRLR